MMRFLIFFVFVIFLFYHFIRFFFVQRPIQKNYTEPKAKTLVRDPSTGTYRVMD